MRPPVSVLICGLAVKIPDLIKAGLSEFLKEKRKMEILFWVVCGLFLAAYLFDLARKLIWRQI